MLQEEHKAKWNGRLMFAGLLGVAVYAAVFGTASMRERKQAESAHVASNVPQPFDLDKDQVVKLGLYGAECVDGKLSYREPQPDGSNSLKTYTIFRDSVDRGMHFGVTEHIRCTTGSQGNPI
ncbi:hypothetical protein L4Z64_001482 [Pseudomonas aeruginosa]|nr:hypothetical protein [Pseudomonas aeruginosa]